MDELKVGDKIRDNDLRMGENRVLTVTDVTPGYRVLARDIHGRTVKIARERIFTDEKARKSGFSRISKSS